MLAQIGYRPDAGEITREQAGRIATRNNLETAAAPNDNRIELPPGTRVMLDDLWQGTRGIRSFSGQLEALAAQCGAVIEHPGSRSYPNAHGNITPESYFIVPYEHGGARPGAGRPGLGGATIRFSVTLTQEQSDFLASLAASRSEALRQLIDAAMSEV